MDIITAEAQQIDEKKGQGKPKITLALPFEIKIKAEAKRQGHPTKNSLGISTDVPDAIPKRCFSAS